MRSPPGCIDQNYGHRKSRKVRSVPGGSWILVGVAAPHLARSSRLLAFRLPAFRLQCVGWRDVSEYAAVYGPPERWTSNGFIKKLQVRMGDCAAAPSRPHTRLTPVVGLRPAPCCSAGEEDGVLHVLARARRMRTQARAAGEGVHLRAGQGQVKRVPRALRSSSRGCTALRGQCDACTTRLPPQDFRLPSLPAATLQARQSRPRRWSPPVLSLHPIKLNWRSGHHGSIAGCLVAHAACRRGGSASA